MGVINITPNSFSDGGKFLDPAKISEFVSTASGFEKYVLDIGAQSTAPFNSAISAEEEINRFDQYFLPLIKDLNLANKTIVSIDTYYPEVMRYVLESIDHSRLTFLWNDVSGKIDSSCIELLKEYKNLLYVYSHNLCPTRSEAASHMNYVNRNLSAKSLTNFFTSATSKFKEQDISLDRIYFDPCYGFSKTKEQNYELIKNAQEYMSCHDQWIIGVSKKSFLQALSDKKEKCERIAESEFFHVLILSQFMNDFPNKNIIFRIHNFDTYWKAVKSLIFQS